MNYSGLILEHKMPDKKKEILHYLRAKYYYFKIYSLKSFAGQKKSLIGPDSTRGSPYADRWSILYPHSVCLTLYRLCPLTSCRLKTGIIRTSIIWPRDFGKKFSRKVTNGRITEKRVCHSFFSMGKFRYIFFPFFMRKRFMRLVVIIL